MNWKRQILTILSIVTAAQASAQIESHTTMFMYNKMYYNPAYTANKEVTSIGGYYRDQWSGIEGAPKTMGISFETAIGSRDVEVKQTGIGLTVTSEEIGVEKKQDVFGYYTFRFKTDNGSILSFGFRVGTQLYSANYSTLNPSQVNDPNLAKNVDNASLFNFGLGGFWHGENYYAGFGIPNLIENYYDKNEKPNLKNIRGKQVRGYYLGGGYVFHSSENLDILPQFMARYQGDGQYSLPFNADINLSFIAIRRMMFGLTYRTDKSFEAMFNLQVTRNINVGYAYDYLVSSLNGYAGGAHEVVLGFDFGRKREYGYGPERVQYLSLF
jgi:type IX secretion system PorP/SprF family membrane protein